MSSSEDKTQEVVGDVPEADTADSAGDSDHAAPVSEAGGVVMLFFIIGFAASMILGWLIFPKLLYSKKQQPINFNHALHVEEVDEGCESCHYFREDGTFSGIPKLESCIECHEEVQGESEDEAIFVEQYVAKNREVPWHVYAKQPDCVFFSHVAHVKMGGMDCTTCHGHIGESESLRPFEENRITGYSRDIWGQNISGFTRDPQHRMKMDVCSHCHVRNDVNQNSVQTLKGGCFVCHK